MSATARIRLKINGHTLTGEKGAAGWRLTCPSWPDLAEAYDGCEDASPCLEEFERRATAGGRTDEIEERKECV
jgi:hypothetical protein